MPSLISVLFWYSVALRDIVGITPWAEPISQHEDTAQCLPASAPGGCQFQFSVASRSAKRAECQSLLSNQQVHEPASQVCEGPFSDRSLAAHGARRIALVVRGESFRGERGQHDRGITADTKAWNLQREASESHIKHVAERLEACLFAVDVFLVTYVPKPVPASEHPDPQRDLVDFYGERVADKRFLEHGATNQSSQANSYAQGLNIVAEHHRRTGAIYEGLLITRFDMIFKQSIPDLRGANWENILFAFREWEMGGGRSRRVPDTLIWFPWIYANCAVKAGFMEHNFCGIEDVTNSSVGFLLDEYHDSNSMIDWNPLYRLVRPEQKFDIHGGFAVLVAGVRGEPRTVKFADVRNSLRKHVELQGAPPLVPADFYVHIWTPHVCQKKSGFEAIGAKDDLAFCGDYMDVQTSLDNQRPIVHPSLWTSIFRGLGTWWRSFLHESRSSDHIDVSASRHMGTSSMNPTLREQFLMDVHAWRVSLSNTTRAMNRIQHRDNFTYDRIFLVRDDYVYWQDHRQLMDYDVSKVHAGFFATIAPWIPAMLVLSADAVRKLTLSTEAEDLWPTADSQDWDDQHIRLVRQWIERSTSMEVVSITS